MKLYEKHERRSMITHWVGRYKKHAVEITQAQEYGHATGYWFLCKCGDKSYSSLWDHKLYKTLEDAEAAAIKYIDDETEKREKK